MQSSKYDLGLERLEFYLIRLYHADGRRMQEATKDGGEEKEVCYVRRYSVYVLDQIRDPPFRKHHSLITFFFLFSFFFFFVIIFSIWIRSWQCKWSLDVESMFSLLWDSRDRKPHQPQCCATRKSPRIMKSTTDSPVKEILEIQLSPQNITTTHHVSTREVSNDPGQNFTSLTF